jgi:hypothetical protein
VDNGLEAAELVDLVGNCPCSSDGREVSGDNSRGAGCRREGVATSTLVSPVQHGLMAFVDEEPGRHQAEAVR